MLHQEAQSLLEAYVDDQLEVAETLRIEAHVSECERCQDWLEDRSALITRVRSAPLRHALPSDLARRIRRQVMTEGSWVRSAEWTRALAAGLVLGMVGLWVGHSLPQREAGADEWVSAHVRSTLGSRSVDVLSSSHHTVKPWLSSKLPFSPPVPELNDQGDTLIGARAEYIERRPMAALVYQHGHHQIDVFVWPSSQGPAPKVSDTPIEGFNLAVTQVPEFNAVIVSDMSVQETNAFRERWRARAISP